MNDNAKILLKQQLEEQDLRQTQYETRDNRDYPGWTLLLKDVVKAYGICPFLNVWDEECNERRAAWISSQLDGGEAYYAAVNVMTDESMVTEIETALQYAREQLEKHTRELVFRTQLPGNVTFEELIDNVYKRRDAKSQNKKSKECWSETLRCLDVLAKEARIDFAKYVNVQTGYQFRYKVPDAETPMDEQFNRGYDEYMHNQGRLHSLHTLRDREIGNAKKQLAGLILDNFQVEQTGRYYRRWTALSVEKQAERIASYCYWYMREQGQSVVAAEAMITFVKEKLATKELKVSSNGLDWNGKQGIVVNIQVAFCPATSSFSLITNDVSGGIKKRRPTKKKNEDIFQTDRGKMVQARANRLMLYEIVKTGSTHRVTVVEAVLRHLRCRWLPSTSLRAYLSTRYDEMITVIKANPIASGHVQNEVNL